MYLVPLFKPSLNSTVDEDFIHFAIDLGNITWRGFHHGIDLWYQRKDMLSKDVIDEAKWNETE